jgi:hypothetical protein
MLHRVHSYITSHNRLALCFFFGYLFVTKYLVIIHQLEACYDHPSSHMKTRHFLLIL